MIEVGLDPLTSSEAERLVAFHPRFIGDGQALREDGLTESAQVAQGLGGSPRRYPRCRLAGRTECGV
jgi:hypothetical protein